jgi:hypothetical protein
MSNIISLIMKKITGGNQSYTDSNTDLEKAERIYQVQNKYSHFLTSADEQDLLFACRVFRDNIKDKHHE